MNRAQRIIKYAAIALAISLIISIVTGILTVVFTALGISYIVEIGENSIETMNVSQEYVNIHEIDLEVAASSIEIIKADSLKVEGTNIPKDYDFTEKNGKLEIKGKKIKSGAKIVIYMPSEINSLDIEVGAGNITIKDITLQEIRLDTGAAKTDITGLIVTTKADINTGVGETNIIDSDITNLDMDTGIGSVELNGYLKGASDIDCGVGNLDIDLLGTEAFYRIIAERGIGNLVINGTKVSGEQNIGTGNNILKISGGIGNLDISY